MKLRPRKARGRGAHRARARRGSGAGAARERPSGGRDALLSLFCPACSVPAQEFHSGNLQFLIIYWEFLPVEAKLCDTFNKTSERTSHEDFHERALRAAHGHRHCRTCRRGAGGAARIGSAHGHFGEIYGTARRPAHPLRRPAQHARRPRRPATSCGRARAAWPPSPVWKRVRASAPCAANARRSISGPGSTVR